METLLLGDTLQLGEKSAYVFLRGAGVQKKLSVPLMNSEPFVNNCKLVLVSQVH
jgi:hypothetical protein